MKQGLVITMPGEGIGPEIVSAGRRVLEVVARRDGLALETQELVVGLPAIARGESAFPAEAEALCDRHREDPNAAILFGAVSDEPIGILRKRYDLFANLRPARVEAPLLSLSPLAPDVVRGTDVLVVRELASGLYYGERTQGESDGGRWYAQSMWYHESEMRRISRVAVRAAASRRGRVTFAEKGNVIPDLFERWNAILREEAAAVPGVQVESMYVDNLAMQLVLRPTRFDVILADNMFGDILSDLLAGVVGSIGLCPSSSRNAHGFGLYESIGGTAPDIAGRDIANPFSTIACVAMMLRDTFGRAEAAAAVDAALLRTLASTRTADLRAEGVEVVGTRAFTERVVRELEA